MPLHGAVNACPPEGRLDLGVTDGQPGSVAVLGLGLDQASIPLLGCNLLVGSVLGTTTLSLDAAGAGNCLLPLPLGVAGATFSAQSSALDLGGPQGFTATNGLLGRVP